MAYQVAGELRYLNATVNGHRIIQDTQLFATGGYPPSERLANAYGSLGDSLWFEEKAFEMPCGTWAPSSCRGI